MSNLNLHIWAIYGSYPKLFNYLNFTFAYISIFFTLYVLKNCGRQRVKTLSLLITSAYIASLSCHAALAHNLKQKEKKHNKTVSKTVPQINIFEAHKDKQNYVIALYTNATGAALVAYDSPTCQANSYGETRIEKTQPLEIVFTSAEDTHCKITFKLKDSKLFVTNETPSCSTWHGDFCSFSSLSPLSRLYPP